jgi:hypothetical protein
VFLKCTIKSLKCKYRHRELIKVLCKESELKEKLGISRQTVVNWRKKGMPFIKINKAVRYDYNDCMEWVKQYSSDRVKG